MKLQLVTLAGTKLDEDVYSVQIPTINGEIGVFENHESLVTIASAGVLQVRRKKDDPADDFEYYAINGGAVQILDNTIKILVDEAENADEIVAEEAELALERAREQHASAENVIDISEAEALMSRAEVRLKVANLHRGKHRH